MDNNSSNSNLQPTVELNDSSSYENFSPRSVSTAPYCKLPKKSRQQQQSKDKSSIYRAQYPDDIAGTINFDFVLNVGDSPSNCIYSKKLKKIYIPTNQMLRIKFTWTSTFQPLFLRSAMMFINEYHAAIPVQKCYAHMGPQIQDRRHVFRVSASSANNNCYESIYETDHKGILSSKTILKPESGEAWIDYQLYCQNSCPTGINRRATRFVFLIENAMGLVIAKKSLLIQICANPKRDKDRDEGRISSDCNKLKIKKQSSTLPPLSPPPKNSQSTTDQTVYTLDIQVLGEQNYRAVLRYAYDLMASQAIRTANYLLFKPHMDALLIKESD